MAQVKKEATSKKSNVATTKKQTSSKKANEKENNTKSSRNINKDSKKVQKNKTTNTTAKTVKNKKVEKNKKDVKNNQSSKNKGKVTKITASKKPEEIVEENDDIVITVAKDSSTEVVKFEDEQKMQLVEEEIKKDLKSKNKLPKEEEKKSSSVVFENLCVAISFMIYLFFIILGYINIKEAVYIVDLKVLSFILLIIAILLFERAYKKDSGALCAFGIETLFLSITTMGLLYVNIELKNMFLPIAAIISLLFAIYYIAKSIYLYTKMKKKYFVDNMKDIMQKEEK